MHNELCQLQVLKESHGTYISASFEYTRMKERGW